VKRNTCAAALISLSALVAPTNGRADLLAVWNEHGTAGTPTAPNALRIVARVAVRRDSPDAVSMRIAVRTANTAMMDNGTGCVRVGFFSGETLVSSFEGCSPRNPGRGLGPETIREGVSVHEVPPGLNANRVAFQFFNPENNGGSVPWIEVARIAATLLL